MQEVNKLETDPMVSILIPSYNHEKYVAETIQSVLDQTYQNFEILITDDCSSDMTVENIKHFKDPRIQLVQFEDNKGSCVAGHNCFDRACGEYISILNSDDIFFPEKLKKQVKFLTENLEIGAVLSYAQIIDEDSNEFTDKNHFYYNIFNQPNRTRHQWLRHFFYSGNCLCHPSLLIRRECYDTVGFYDCRFFQLPDFDFFIRLCMQYEIHIIPENLVKFRIRANEANVSGDKPETRVRTGWETQQILKKNYLKINDRDEFLRIFPETFPDKDKMDSDTIPFFLAMLALRSETSNNYKYFATETLYNLLGDETVAKKLEQRCGFTYNKFKNLTSKFNINIKPTPFSKLYIDTGIGFNEKQVITKAISGDERKIEFDLADYNDIRRLQFNPIKDAVVLYINKIDILTKKGNLEQAQIDDTNATYTRNSNYIFNTKDPILYIDIIKKEELKRISIYLQYVAVGNNVHEYIKKEKDEQLKEKDEQLKEKDEQLKEKAKQLQIKNNLIQVKNLENKNNIQWMIDKWQQIISQKESEIQNRELIINTITHSNAWKLTHLYRSIISRVTGKKALKPIGQTEQVTPQKTGQILVNCDQAKVCLDTLVVKGWAISDNGINRIEIYLDNTLIGNADYGYKRQDVERSHPFIQNSGKSGFHLFADISEFLKPEAVDYSLLIKAVGANGQSREFVKTVSYNNKENETICVDDLDIIRITSNNHIHYCVNRLDINCDLITFAGWIFSEHEKLKSVTLVVEQNDIKKSFNLRYHLDRKDVFEIYGIDNAIYCGFSDKIYLKGIYGKVVARLLVEFMNGDKEAVFNCDCFIRKREASNQIDTIISGKKIKNNDDLKRLSVFNMRTFLNTHEVIQFPIFKEPILTIILVLFNRSELTLQCLESIKIHADVPYQIVILDNGSSDETTELLRQIENVKILKNNQNVGFLTACNQAVEHAYTKYILFLNNDTQILSRTLSSLVNTMESDSKVGVVGGKIIFTNGRLQEAGSIIWRDGSCSGYGRNDDPFKPEYSYVREVFFCSGALLATIRTLFIESGMFDEIYCPAYYEEVDYCMKVRAEGFKVIYQPAAQLIHHEFASSRKPEEAIKLQISNKAKFKQKWSDHIKKYLPPHQTNLLWAREFMGKSKRKILFIDDTIPDPIWGGGLGRSFDILNALIDRNFSITIFPLQYQNKRASIINHFQQKGIEVIYDHTGKKDKLNFEKFLTNRKSYYDIILISRPHNIQELSVLIDHFDLKDKIIYDAEAIFSVRECLRLEIKGEKISEEEKDSMIQKEVNMTAYANQVISVSKNEKRIFQRYGVNNVHIVSLSVNLKLTQASFRERKHILFVGSMLDLAVMSPNVDAILYFVKHIYPSVYEDTGAKLYIVGTNQSELVLNLASEKIIVTGQVESILNYYNSCRLFIVPTRYAAGIPCKFYEASSYGLPSVVSPLIAEQVGGKEGENMLIGHSTNEFVNKCVQLYKDENLWNKIRNGAIKKVEKDCNPQVFKNNLHNALNFDGFVKSRKI